MITVCQAHTVISHQGKLIDVEATKNSFALCVASTTIMEQ